MVAESRPLGLRDLVFFNIAAVIGIRWLAAAAHAGPGSLTLWVVAAAMFFVPSAAVVSELSRRHPGSGGIYLWTKSGFGDWHAFLCGYCYLVTNLFYFPSLVLAGVAMSVSLAGPEHAALADNRAFVLPVSVLALVGVTLANIVGLGVARWLGNVGGTATYMAGAILMATAAVVWWRHGSQTPIDLVPRPEWDKLNFWPQIAFAFGGLELGAFFGTEVRGGERSVRRAAWIGGAAIAAFYVSGTLALLVTLPHDKISEVTGLTQAGVEAGRILGSSWPGTLLTAFVALGVAGQLSAWIGGSARLPLLLGIDRFLPPAFAKLHPRWGTPALALAIQAALCVVFLVATQLGDTLRVGYQLLVDITVVTYFIPFAYMFLAAWRAGLRWSAASGLLVTGAAIGFSFVPPPGASAWLFELKLAGGTAALVGLARWWYRLR
jgi:amino acid transporter